MQNFKNPYNLASTLNTCTMNEKKIKHMPIIDGIAF